jgi:hypothetical protein
MEEPKTISPDHDLLIELRTEMRGLRDDFKESANLVTGQISALQTGKVDKDDFNRFIISYEKSKDDHERRLRSTEVWKYYLIAGLTIFEVLIQVILAKYFHQ